MLDLMSSDCTIGKKSFCPGSMDTSMVIDSSMQYNIAQYILVNQLIVFLCGSRYLI